MRTDLHRRVMVASSLPMASQEPWEGALAIRSFAINLFCRDMVTPKCLLYKVNLALQSIGAESDSSATESPNSAGQTSIQGVGSHEQERTSGASNTQGQCPSADRPSAVPVR